MNEELKGAKKHFEDCYFSDEASNRIKNGVRKVAVDQPQASVSYLYGGKKKQSVRRRIFYPAIAVLILFAALAGATYFSPAVAKVAAQVPYFRHFIKQEAYKQELYDVAGQTVKELGYNIQDIDASIPKKELNIGITGSEKTFDKAKEQVPKQIRQALIENNFGRYKINLKHVEPHVKITESMRKQNEKYMKATLALQKKLNKIINDNGYILTEPLQAAINYKGQHIVALIPATTSDKKITELRELLKANAADVKPLDINIRKVNVTAQQEEDKWDSFGIMGILAQGLMENKHYKVTGYSYSFHPLPLQIGVKTSLDASDPKDQRIADEIREQIDYFIQHNERTQDVRNDPYVLTIYSKDHKKMK